MSISEANKPLADGIRVLIIKNGLKNSYIAQKAGYTDQNLSDMLNGRKLIKACDIPRLAYALNVSSDEIYEAGREAT